MIDELVNKASGNIQYIFKHEKILEYCCLNNNGSHTQNGNPSYFVKMILGKERVRWIL